MPIYPISISPNDYSGTDTERINQAIQTAATGCGHVTIPRVNVAGDGARNIWLLDSAILLPSDITIELQDCHLKLSDACRDNFFRSANCGLGVQTIQPLSNIHLLGVGNPILEGADHPRATGDSAKTLGANSYGTDAGRAGESQTGDWRNIGILLASVENFSIHNLTIIDSHCWAISLEYCAHGILRDIDFRSAGNKIIDGVQQTLLNQDGIDLRQGCRDISIENITGYTGDDLIALTGIPHAAAMAGELASTMISGHNSLPVNERDDICRIVLRNIKGYCQGGHQIVRLLNSSGIRLYDIIIDGLLDTSPPEVQCYATVRIGDANPKWGGVTPLGDTFRILITNVIGRSRHHILLAGSLTDSIIANMICHGGENEPLTLQSGPEMASNVTLSNVVTSLVKYARE